MPGITFGSVGDIIALGQLAWGRAKALSDARGSAKEYQSLEKDLKAFDQALLQVIALWQNYEDSPELEELGSITKLAATEWRDLLLEFRSKVDKKYGTNLCVGSSSARLKTSAKKILWLKEKDDILELRRRLGTASDAITILILAAMGKSNKLDASRNTSRVIIVNSMIETTVRLAEEQTTQLKLINQRLESQAETTSLLLGTVRSGQAYLAQVPSIAIDLKTLLAAFQNHILTQQAIPQGLDTHWKQDPVTLEDARGFMIPIPLELVTSWEMLNMILIKRFEQHPGHHRLIESGLFAIEENLTGRELIRTSEWSMSFRPGQKVNMSVTFFNKQAKSSHCPGCKTKVAASYDSGAQCGNCKMWFRRIAEADPVTVDKLQLEYINCYDVNNFLYPLDISKRPAWPEDFQRVRLIDISTDETCLHETWLRHQGNNHLIPPQSSNSANG